MEARKFWEGMEKIPVLQLLDKFLIGRNATGQTMYADINQIRVLLAAFLTGQLIPQVVEPGSTIGKPEDATLLYVGPGTYTVSTSPDESITTTENLSILLWDKSEWSKLEIPVTVPLDDTGTSASIDTAATANSVRRINEKIDNTFPNSIVSSYSLAIVDAEDRVMAYFDNQGKFKVFDWVNNTIPQAALQSLSITLSNLSNDVKSLINEPLSTSNSGYVLAIIDAEDKVLLGIDAGGNVIAGGVSVSLLKSKIDELRLEVDELSQGIGFLQYVICIGDSLTAGAGGGGTNYPGVLQSLLGDKFIVQNNGVGGENVPTIAARMGGMPIVITSDISLPASKNTGVVIGTFTPYNLIRNVLGRETSVLVQSTSDKVNPVIVAGVECTIVRTGATQSERTWTLFRNTDSAEPTPIKSGELIITVKSRTIPRGQIGVIFVGQNGGYDDDNNLLIRYINSMIKLYQFKDFIIIGLMTGTRSDRAAYELALTQEYGLRFLKAREYMSTYGLKMAGITPTQDDLAKMAVGSMPSSFWATPEDSIHLNAAGYTVLGQLIYRRFQELNIK